jgi:hypothetical protein
MMSTFLCHELVTGAPALCADVLIMFPVGGLGNRHAARRDGVSTP